MDGKRKLMGERGDAKNGSARDDELSSPSKSLHVSVSSSDP